MLLTADALPRIVQKGPSRFALDDHMPHIMRRMSFWWTGLGGTLPTLCAWGPWLCVRWAIGPIGLVAMGPGPYGPCANGP